MTTLSDSELARNAGITVPVLKAIRAVESGSRPSAIRFEPRLFLAARPDLASQVPYTPTGTGSERYGLVSETNRAAFEHAYALDAREAVKATSWGTYQVLGGKLILLYGSPDAGVEAFWANPTDVSNRLLVKWMLDNPAARDAAARQDWFGFVCRYNGCGDGCTERSGCLRYLSRFEAAYAAAVGGSGGGLVLLAAAGGTAWWYFRSRRPGRSRR